MSRVRQIKNEGKGSRDTRAQGQYEVSKRRGKEESSGARPCACAETDK